MKNYFENWKDPISCAIQKWKFDMCPQFCDHLTIIYSTTLPLHLHLYAKLNVPVFEYLIETSYPKKFINHKLYFT